MSNSNTIPITFGQGQVRTPGNNTNIQAIKSTLSGGSGTADFMSSQIPYSLFMQNVGNSLIDVIWSTLGYTNSSGEWVDTGIPISFAQEGSGENMILMLSYGTVVKSVWEQMEHPNGDIPETQELCIKHKKDYSFGTIKDIVVENASFYKGRNIVQLDAEAEGTAPEGYNIVGSVETRFEYSQTPIWTATLPTMAATTVMSIPFGLVSFSQFVKPLIKTGWNGVKKLWGSMTKSSGLEESEALLGDAAAELTTETIIDEGLTLTTAAVGAACFGVVLALAAIPVIVSLLAHYSYNVIQVYNLSSKYDFVWDDPHIYSGTMNMAPVIQQDSDVYEQLIPGERSTQPNPFVTPVDTYGSGNFSFVSESAYKGLGEAFGFSLYTINPDAVTASDYDGDTPAGYGAFALNIPWEGDNSLDCEFSSTPVSSDSYWNSFSHRNELSYTATDSDLGVKLTITFDYLSGEHPNNQGTEEYYYQSVLTLEDA